MTGPPYGLNSGAHWQQPRLDTSSPGPPNTQKPNHTLGIVAISLAAVAILVSVGSSFLPARFDDSAARDTPAVEYSAEQQSKATAAVCEARLLVNEAGDVSGGKTSDDPDMRFAIAINIRVAGTLSGDYLATVLEQNPATPEDLASSVQKLIAAYSKITLLQLADASQERLEPIYEELDSSDAEVAQECE
ncbi:hypothetical protein MMUR_13790 [Mycolicibacterium murale]|jgi:hypothetical protein|uniref:Alanine and proline rich membrane protein n=1 Tax=Mycolicibacterium murale TaxID=182220 RepID=A0A7I9WHW1_9MYCO|nr:hypothetical protein [Mycolicibacterium murale]MCV7185161.1 hypothetical protein [Mycolicibacterium murale]GFG57243.1 hypothetical protein MMUR_13790 [Mycolicibacterium murale]